MKDYITKSIGVGTVERRAAIRKKMVLLAAKRGMTQAEILETGIALIEKQPFKDRAAGRKK